MRPNLSISCLATAAFSFEAFIATLWRSHQQETHALKWEQEKKNAWLKIINLAKIKNLLQF